MSPDDGALEKDYYEVLQLSPHADSETVERVFRHLAKRFHPDNGETGDAERFSAVVEAHRVLGDPERRAAYDAGYSKLQEQQWQLFDQASAVGGVEGDRRVRLGILTVLYQARRRDVDRPGVGILDLERILGCPQDHMRFHLWYMKEKGWVNRQDNGLLAVTATGVDHLNTQELPWKNKQLRLKGPESVEAREAGPVGGDQGQPRQNAPNQPGRGAGAPGSRVNEPAYMGNGVG